MFNKKMSSFSPAIQVILIFGFISMLGDMVYESARSANSQYFNLLGISAAQVGLAFGIGEFLGYFLRLLSGVLSDRSNKHWLFIFLGYGLLIVVPMMGFTMQWNVLIVFVLMERIGKALRNPAKDTVLSAVAENQVGTGFAFGIQEALDQVGAFTGPMVFTLIFFLTNKSGVSEYQLGYRGLFIPFIALLLFVLYAYFRIKKDNLIPKVNVREFRYEKLKPIFWVYTVFTFFCTLGFINFSLIGYHLKAQSLMSDANITLIYAVGMVVDAAAALIVGKIYDRLKIKVGKKSGGLNMLLIIPFFTLLLPFLTLSYSMTAIIIGMIFFGIIMGTHETIMRSAIADITPYYKRGTSFGIFNTAYGLALFIGAAMAGWLYDSKMNMVIILLTSICEIIAIVLYYRIYKMVKDE